MKRILIASIIVVSLLNACTPNGGGGDKVRIGVFMSTTGTTANFGISSVNGIKLAADEINAAGGINGKQVELLVQDDRSDASEAATIVTKFVTQDQVHAVIGEVASSRSIGPAQSLRKLRPLLVLRYRAANRRKASAVCRRWPIIFSGTKSSCTFSPLGRCRFG